jgi:hypothetical protein
MMFGSAELQRNPNPSDNKRSWNGWKSMMSKILLDTLYSFIQQLSQRVQDLRLEEPDLTQNHSFGGDFTECTVFGQLQIIYGGCWRNDHIVAQVPMDPVFCS